MSEDEDQPSIIISPIAQTLDDKMRAKGKNVVPRGHPDHSGLQGGGGLIAAGLVGTAALGTAFVLHETHKHGTVAAGNREGAMTKASTWHERQEDATVTVPPPDAAKNALERLAKERAEAELKKADGKGTKGSTPDL